MFSRVYLRRNYEPMLAELRDSVFEAIEEEDKVIEKEDGLPPALLGSCNDRAKQLHSPSGRLLTALICEYLDWSQLNHTLKRARLSTNSCGRHATRSTTALPSALSSISRSLLAQLSSSSSK
ncbi:hypothetical protein SASPL_141082 [Salvia splendens]|uniref:LisH domain-containing protein n=1 Tax=Salvia splendens TaxID=180675 RepID=A0A8X8WTE2_SALSN|nr:hypothetical protein SASPL_141082 [Salvia splendens]